MKTITLRVEDCDQVVIDELKDAYHRNNKFDRVDCSDTVIDPDYELLQAIQTVLEYYMTAEELELWNNYEKDKCIVHGRSNRAGQGKHIEEIYSPYRSMMRTEKVMSIDSFFNQMVKEDD